LNRLLAWSEGKVDRYDIDKHEGDHQHYSSPDSPIPMRVPPKMVARMLVIARLNAFAFNRVLVAAHDAPIRKKPA
jgi:hypothetical protein